jgi:hypothetical protein
MAAVLAGLDFLNPPVSGRSLEKSCNNPAGGDNLK